MVKPFTWSQPNIACMKTKLNAQRLTKTQEPKLAAVNAYKSISKQETVFGHVQIWGSGPSGPNFGTVNAIHLINSLNLIQSAHQWHIDWLFLKSSAVVYKCKIAGHLHSLTEETTRSKSNTKLLKLKSTSSLLQWCRGWHEDVRML